MPMTWTQAAIALVLMLLAFSRPAAAQTVADARAALPEAVRSAGVLRVATSLQWPPFAYRSEAGQPDGIDIRIMKLIAEKLGLRLDIADVAFPSIVPGVADGRFDAGVDQINITAERAKAVGFVPYSQEGLGLLVRKGTAGVDATDLCGRTLLLTQGSAQVGIADELSKRCVASGNRPIASQTFANSADTYLALATGRGDGFLAGQAVGRYIASQNGKLAMTVAKLPGFDTVSGIVVAKRQPSVQDAVRLALESALGDGSYRKVFDDYQVPDDALSLEQIRQQPP